MNIDTLNLKTFDFRESSAFYWIIRRVFIGFYLFIIYMYAILFAILVQTGELKTTMAELNVHESQNELNLKKKTVTDIERSEKLVAEQNSDGGDDFNKYFPKTHLQLMLLFGALGAVFMITRTFVRTVDKIDLPVVWYLTRPFQGALMAIFIYLAFLAGQIAFYSGKGDAVNPNEINVYTISLLAIIAGMFTDHAYTRLLRVAERLLIKEATDSKDIETSD